MSKHAMQPGDVIVAEVAGEGSYGFAYEHRLIRRGSNIHLLMDHWGDDGTGAFCYRPRLSHPLTEEEAVRAEKLMREGWAENSLDSRSEKWERLLELGYSPR